MRVAIIGAGFTGLSAAHELLRDGHKVTLFEKDNNPGGLAIGFKEKKWKWTLEQHYHHWFTNDHHILSLAKEIKYPVVVRIPETNWYVNGKIYKFVSLKAALTFPLLTPLERVRQLFVLGILRMNPFWQPLEKYKTNDILPRLMGKRIYEMLWKSLLFNKFGKYADDISFAWFWARIKKRTQTLAYPEGGFLKFAQSLAEIIKEQGGNIFYGVSIKKIEEKNGFFFLGSYGSFDKIIVTIPSFAFAKLMPQLSKKYKDSLNQLKGLGASNLVLRLKKPFFPDKTYWLSIADAASPVMAIVEHTNFMNKKYYNNEHLVYLGNYLSANSDNYFKTKEQLLELYDPFLQKIHPNYQKNLINYQLFKVPFAQPIVQTNYSEIIPSFETPIKGIYLASVQQVYPWDRGTNYAVELGKKVADFVQDNS